MDDGVLNKDIRFFAEHFGLWKHLRDKTFLITGATGLIGSVMIKCLLELSRQKSLNIKIKAIIRNEEKAKKVFKDVFSQIEFYQIHENLTIYEQIGTQTDYIVHLASPTASKYFVEYPVETLNVAFNGTATVLEYAKRVNAKAMVYASSLEVYGSNHTDDLIKEDFQGYVNPINVRSSYNIGKRACECLCHSYAEEYGVNVMIARMTQTFGAGVDYNDNRVFAQFVRKVIEGNDIELHTDGATCRMYCYTTDAVSALLYLLLKGEKGEAYNIANKKSYISIREMAQLLKEEFNQSINVAIVPKENMGYAPETKLKLDTKKIESLGWKPQYDLRNMFKNMILYLKEN